jgi:hypothetical protein
MEFDFLWSYKVYMWPYNSSEASACVGETMSTIFFKGKGSLCFYKNLYYGTTRVEGQFYLVIEYFQRRILTSLMVNIRCFP